VLQRSCERPVILATSREGLGIEGEQLLPVPPLGVPEADASLEAINQAEAVRLFADRAAAVKPGFQVTAQNAAAVAAVVRRLDGIALAVELAAARVPAMTVAELARRLERSFAVLGAGPRGAVERHQTLRAAIDWSYGLLAGPEQRLLARLAVFAGGATLQAAEGVCGGDGIDPDAVLELLAALVARSLVVAEEHGPQSRYRLLEPIRQYGEERLEAAGETEQWRVRTEMTSRSAISAFVRCSATPASTSASRAEMPVACSAGSSAHHVIVTPNPAGRCLRPAQSAHRAACPAPPRTHDTPAANAKPAGQARQ
jgi:predicted ATPase